MMMMIIIIIIIIIIIMFATSDLTYLLETFLLLTHIFSSFCRLTTLIKKLRFFTQARH